MFQGDRSVELHPEVGHRLRGRAVTLERGVSPILRDDERQKTSANNLRFVTQSLQEPVDTEGRVHASLVVVAGELASQALIHHTEHPLGHPCSA